MAPIQHLCLLFAMREEADSLIKSLKLTSSGQLKKPYPMQLYQGQQNNVQLSVVLAGVDQRFAVDYVGTEPATLMASVALDILQPDLLITAGTAGGFKRHTNNIGDIVISADTFVYHDHHVPLSGLHDSALGHYPAVDASRLCSDLGFFPGIISSGSSLAKNATDIEAMGLFDARAKDMEAAAIAWVAMLHQVPCMAVKAITNLVDEDNRSEDEFLANFNIAATSLTTALLDIIVYVQDKTIADLAH